MSGAGNRHSRDAGQARPPSLPAWVLLLQLFAFASPFLVLALHRGTKRSKIPLDAALQGLAISLFVLVIAWLATRHAARSRAGTLAGTREVNLMEARSGYLSIKGTARPLPGSAASDPGAGVPCAWWRCLTYERETGLDRRWMNLLEDRTSNAFLLEGRSGRCIVEPQGADLNVSTRRWDEGERIHLLQYIPSGASVGVAGELRAAADPGSEAAKRAASGELLRQWKEDQPALARRFDSDYDGKIDQGEWERARSAAEVEAARQLAQPGGGLLRRMAKPRDGRPFLVFEGGELEMIERYDKVPRAFLLAALVWYGLLWGFFFSIFVRW